MRSASIITAFTLIACAVASPVATVPPGTVVDPGIRVPKGVWCVTMNEPGVLGCNTGDGGTFNIINGKFVNCAGCTKENGYGK